jgi:hypothetical protein
MYATDDVTDAFEATKAFLLPFEFRRWLRIAFVTFFLGGLGANFSAPSLVTGGGEFPPSGQPPEGFWLVAGGVVTLVVLVAVAFAAVRGVMDLVLLESLREEEVDLERFWGARWRQGLQLFAFRFGATLAGAALVALPVGLVYVGAENDGAATLAVGLLLLVPVLLVVPPGVALLKGFTASFVAPAMLLDDVGVIAGWRRFWSTLVGDWQEFAGYAVVNFGLLLAVGVALSVGAVVGALVLAVPFTPVLFVGDLVGDAVPLAGTAIFAVSGSLYAVAVVVIAAFVKAPLIVFVRTYALFVLGDVDDDLDLVPVTRQAVRSEPDDA